MPLRVRAHQCKRVRHLAVGQVFVFRSLFEDEDSTIRLNLVWKLRLTPADIHGSNDVIKQVSCDTTGIIPVLTESEVTVGVPRALIVLCWAQPHLPVDEVLS